MNDTKEDRSPKTEALVKIGSSAAGGAFLGAALFSIAVPVLGSMLGGAIGGFIGAAAAGYDALKSKYDK